MCIRDRVCSASQQVALAAHELKKILFSRAITHRNVPQAVHAPERRGSVDRGHQSSEGPIPPYGDRLLNHVEEGCAQTPGSLLQIGISLRKTGSWATGIGLVRMLAANQF